MTLVIDQADGVAPFGTDVRASARRMAEAIAAAQVLVVAAAAMALLAAAPVQPKAAPAATPYRSALAAPVSLTPAAATDIDIDSKQVLQDLLTKAGLRPHFDVHRLSGVQARRINSLMPLTSAPPQAAKPFILAVDTKEGRQALHCLTQAAYFEAGAAGPDAQAGVVQVILNRVRHPDFPKSVCGVIYQGAARQAGCQFTFTCDGSLDRAPDAAAWSQAGKVARRALNGYVVSAVGASTYYHADYVFPAWAPALVKTAAIGPHIFYRMSGAAGDAAALVGRYAGGELKVGHAVLTATDALTQKIGTQKAQLKPASAGPAERTPTGRVHMQIAGAEALSPASPPALAAEPPAAAPAVESPTLATGPA